MKLYYFEVLFQLGGIEPIRVLAKSRLVCTQPDISKVNPLF